MGPGGWGTYEHEGALRQTWVGRVDEVPEASALEAQCHT